MSLSRVSAGACAAFAFRVLSVLRSPLWVLRVCFFGLSLSRSLVSAVVPPLRVWLDDIEVPRVPTVPELPRRPSTEDLQPEIGVDKNGDPP